MPTLKLAQRMTTFVISIALVLVLGALYYLLKQRDAVAMQQTLSNYQQYSLQGFEQPLYLDFVQRRLRVEEVGTPEYLYHLEQTILQKSADDIARIILTDRFFYPYLVDEGRLFMSPSVHQSWKNKRDKSIEPILKTLAERQFGLLPESYGISNLLSHAIVDSHIWRLAANLILLLLLGSYLEPLFGKGKMLLLFVTGAMVSSTSYALLVSLFDNHNEAILQSASGALMALTGMALTSCSSHFLSFKAANIQASANKMRLIAILGLLLFVCLKTGIENASGLIGWKVILSYVVSLLTGALMYQVFRAANPARKETATNENQGWLFRVALSEVMDAISAMDFNAARKKLAAMMKRYPDAIELIEQRYHLENLQSDGDVYWDCVRALIDMSVKKKDYYRMKALFEDIQKNAASKRHAKKRLAPEYYHKMMMIFVAHDDLNKAEQAFLFLELAGHSHIINDACQLLQQEFKTRGNTVKERQYQMLLERL